MDKEEHKRLEIPRANSPNFATEIRIRRVPRKVVEELNNIAAKTGIDLSSLLKPKLLEIVESYPEHYRKPMTDD